MIKKNLIFYLFINFFTIMTFTNITIAEEKSQIDTQITQEKVSEDEDYFKEELEEEITIADPFRVWNKAMFHFNDKLYFWVLKPISKGYSKVVPKDVRASVSNFFNNVATPIRFINNLLQLKFKNAGNELVRFVINSSIGVGGLGDVAKTELDIQINKEDFGQTLGTYGIGHGFYLIWPFIGPSSLRDTIGYVGDRLLDPLTYLVAEEELTNAEGIGIVAYDKVNDTSFRIGDYEAFKESAVDPYEGLRSAYIQYRNKAIEK